MSMDIEEWKKGLDAWTRVKEQAKIDMEQADLYLESISKKIESLEDSEEKK